MSIEKKRSLYRKMYLIRKSEQEIIKTYFDDKMKTPMHMSMGEEAIVAGIVQAVQPNIQAMSTFRSHAAYLSITEETDHFFAEMYGKSGGTANGKSGSMHLCASEKGFMGSSAIVSSAIPTCTGLAFANKMHKNEKIVVSFFGDGATEEGVFWESFNLACLMKLPIIFVCEDNGIAVHAGPEDRRGYKEFIKIAENYDCNVFNAGETTDADEIFDIATKAVEAIRSTEKPALIYAKYYRYLEHVGTNEDFKAGYRDRSEFEAWYLKDPVNSYRDKMVMEIGEGEVIALEREINMQVETSIELAEALPFAELEELYVGVYA